MTEGLGVMSTSFSEGPVFEDNDSVFSDLPSKINSGPEVPKKRDSKHRRNYSTGSSVWNNVIPPPAIDESRNDVLFLSEEEEEEEDANLNELFEDELRASARTTRITVNSSDAGLKDCSAPPLSFFHNESLNKHRSADSEKRDSYIPSALFTDSKKHGLEKAAEKSHHRKKSVDDSILDKVITVAKDSEDADEEEDSLFDTLSQLTKDQHSEKAPFESTLKALIENTGVALDSAVKNIMANTNFAAERIEDADCNFLTPLGDVAACGDMTQKFWTRDEVTIDEESSSSPNEETYIDFGSIEGTENEKGSDHRNDNVPNTNEATREILLSLDGNQVEEEPEESSGENSQHVVACNLSNDGKESLSRSLGKSDKGILITTIDPESELAVSGLKPGMVLLTVNGSLCPSTVVHTVSMIKNTSGDVEVTAAFRGAKVTISPAAPHRGVAEPTIQAIEEAESEDEGFGTATKPSSRSASFFRRLFCFGFTDAMEDEVLGDDGEKQLAQERSVSETTENASESSSKPEKPMRTLTFKVQRLSWQDPIGVKLARGKGGIVVDQIMKNSPFRFTGLRVGMRIHEINGIGCPGSLIVAENLLKGIENDVELVVTTDDKKPDAKPVPLLFYSEI